MIHLETDSVQQGSFGYYLVLPFVIEGHDAPINLETDQWRVKIIKPSGAQITKTQTYFRDSTIAEISIEISALDLNEAGEYSYQIFKTTENNLLRSDVRTFSVIASLPENADSAPPLNPLANAFPVWNGQGVLQPSSLKIVNGVLYFNNQPLQAGGGSPIDFATLIETAEIRVNKNLSLTKSLLKGVGTNAAFEQMDLPRVVAVASATVAGTLNGTYEYAMLQILPDNSLGVLIDGLNNKTVTTVNKTVTVIANFKNNNKFANCKILRRKADSNGVFANDWVDLGVQATFVQDNGIAGTAVAAPVYSATAGGNVSGNFNIYQLAAAAMAIPQSVFNLRPAIWLSAKHEPKTNGTAIKSARNFGRLGGGFGNSGTNEIFTAKSFDFAGNLLPVWEHGDNGRYLIAALDNLNPALVSNYSAYVPQLNFDEYSNGVSFMLLLRETAHTVNYRNGFRLRHGSFSTRNLLFTSGAAQGNFYVTGNVGTVLETGFFGAGDPTVEPSCGANWCLFFFTFDFGTKIVRQRSNGVTFHDQSYPNATAWDNTGTKEVFVGGDGGGSGFPAQFAEVIVDDKAWSVADVLTLERDFKREYKLLF